MGRRRLAEGAGVVEVFDRKRIVEICRDRDSANMVEPVVRRVSRDDGRVGPARC